MRFDELVRSGGPVVTAEFPVVDTDMAALVRHADRLRGWADAVNVTDNTAAHAHASNVAVAVALRGLGLEPIMQVACRDKNRLALQADIVGAALHGVRAVCCLTGDDVTAGDEPQARRVFDLDGPQLIRVACALAEGRYLSGRAIDPAPELLVGAVENPGAPPYSHRVDRAAKKIRAGARFLQLQICYHPDRLAAFMAGAARAGLTSRAAFLPTICLVKGAGGLRFMNEKVPGISVPAETIDRVEKAADPSRAAYELALAQAGHALSLPGVRGLHLVDFRGGDAVPRLLSDLRISRRLTA
ncbi:methylenetetrahydrofolate reductase [Planobispora siamensis]|uniref:Methylenetetrahydrofolate reductase n=1 Tax=Planobispora siamensis TaxID=936338 RepID=A0A8J3WKZ4_9ACTN|nr:methylenetetrahydrofolate reductase [Planobispora siamensis]GIH92087.1 methylenetetrahydrofolate reductase [Planobispora siamensis]